MVPTLSRGQRAETLQIWGNELRFRYIRFGYVRFVWGRMANRPKADTSWKMLVSQRAPHPCLGVTPTNWKSRNQQSSGVWNHANKATKATTVKELLDRHSCQETSYQKVSCPTKQVQTMIIKNWSSFYIRKDNPLFQHIWILTWSCAWTNVSCTDERWDFSMG